MRHRWLRWALLALGVAFSVGGAYVYKQELARETSAKFRAMAIDKASDVDSRVRAYTDVLYALRGLFDASAVVTRDDFHKFAEALALGQRYPGITNISFSLLVPGDQRRAYEQAVRAETSALIKGLPAFSIKPPGERAEYWVLHYLEPMGKNAPAWGLDLMADTLRLSAVLRARDSGTIASVSGVTLLRDGTSGLSSVLFRLAVYRGGGVPNSAAQRQQLVIGVVGSTVRIGELVEATWNKDALDRMRVRIFAGTDAAARADKESTEQLLYDSLASKGAASGADYSEYAVSQNFALGDREWRFVITPLVDPADALNKATFGGVLAGSLALTVLLFWLMSSLATVQAGSHELAQRNREAALLTVLGENLHSCLTIAETYDVLARQMPELLPNTAAVLYMIDAPRSHAAPAARWGAPRAVAEEFTPQDCQAIRRGHSYRVDDASKALNCGHFSGDPPACYVCVPLTAQGEMIGMLHVQPLPNAARPSTGSDGEVNLIKAAAQHIALALANLVLRAKLLERATRDNLTKLYNRHYMLERFEQEIDRAARHRRAIGVIMLDVDHFKRFNDNFGHEAGDVVLREFADVLRRTARGSDVACRHGGEEFLLLMPESTLEGTLAKAEELRREVARLALDYEGRALGIVTISAGVAMYPEHATTANTLLRRADEALYAAKGGGRNRVVVSDARVSASETSEA